MRRRTLTWHVGLVWAWLILGMTMVAHGETDVGRTVRTWANLIEQAGELGLPTGFLRDIDPGFVTVTFEDLRTYAAEYHPEDHRMILNLRLSFNNAGGALMDVDRMTHHDVSLLYHELLHAWLDYLFNGPDPGALSPRASRVLAFAREQLHCHYRFVRITPIRQRRETEMRFLSEEDAWEVLNETWAVFVGWQIWTKLEQHREAGRIGPWTDVLFEEWAARLARANTSRALLGYYEPDEPEERRVAHKRFIASSNGLTPEGAALLLDVVLEEPDNVVARGKLVINDTQDTSEEKLVCD
ncbi:MAG: hypothetical protein OXU40_02945 [Nitrospira sp.]|nr:hypothetical protein [Nitrospira sp.]